MYFDQKLERVSIGNETFPIKIDMYVLEKIQEEYGTLNEFELKVKGLVKNGEVDAEGNTIYDRVEPSVKEMNFVLPIMVREGCEIEGIELDMTDREMIRNSNVSYIDLNKIIVKEFDQCFKTRKKESPSK